MADISTKNAPKLTLTVGIDGEQADIDIDPGKRVGDVIKDALYAFNVDEDPDACHLAGPDRLYFPNQSANDIDLDCGCMISLRLPF